jgi:hypothetical protein
MNTEYLNDLYNGGFMKKTIEDYDLNDKKVIIRVDFNVPIKDGNITEITTSKGYRFVYTYDDKERINELNREIENLINLKSK